MGPLWLCTGIGVVGVVGILTEPNTYKFRSWTTATRLAVGAHIAASANLAGVGMLQLRRLHGVGRD